ncbi:hypothetical protein CCR75_001973 [Bremia lactucae]|uniref:EamA domain-containing protein n=1 Tax=Bremia lactucae TaxID=4779 RepID=A0A976P011_BRELC|nr:hypothetical protein CCR75_001973 [Bremia lactucae]
MSLNREATEHDKLLRASVLLPSPNVDHRRHKSFDWLLGVTFLVAVALIWTFASVLVQFIFHDLSFHGPFFLSYVGISLFSIHLPLYYISHILWPKVKTYVQNKPPQLRLSPPLHDTGRQASYREIGYISAQISPLWFLANYTYNESLNLTSVSSSTIVSSTSTVFTFLLSVMVLHEPFVKMNVMGVIVCLIGNLTTILNDTKVAQGTNPVLGDFVAFFAAFMYGVYTTAIRALIPHEEQVNLSLFFGFVGLINMIVLLPVVLCFHITGIESLRSLSFEILLLMGVKGLLDNVLSDYLWARAVFLTSPTVATVGLSLTVPMALVADFLFQRIVPTMVTIMASILVILGFVLVNLGTKTHPDDEYLQPFKDKSETNFTGILANN